MQRRRESAKWRERETETERCLEVERCVEYRPRVAALVSGREGGEKERGRETHRFVRMCVRAKRCMFICNGGERLCGQDATGPKPCILRVGWL